MKNEINLINQQVRVKNCSGIAKVEQIYTDDYGCRVARVRFLDSGASMETLIKEIKPIQKQTQI